MLINLCAVIRDEPWQVERRTRIFTVALEDRLVHEVELWLHVLVLESWSIWNQLWKPVVNLLNGSLQEFWVS